MRNLESGKRPPAPLAQLLGIELLAATGSSWSIALYIIATAVITFVAVASIRERFQRDLYETSTTKEESASTAR